MSWYWEAGHFKKELGAMILRRVLVQPKDPPDFGVLLTSRSVVQQILSLNGGEQSYRQSHLKEVEELQAFAIKFGAETQRR